MPSPSMRHARSLLHETPSRRPDMTDRRTFSAATSLGELHPGFRPGPPLRPRWGRGQRRAIALEPHSCRCGRVARLARCTPFRLDRRQARRTGRLRRGRTPRHGCAAVRDARTADRYDAAESRRELRPGERDRRSRSGIQWPELIAELGRRRRRDAPAWSIAQKQTGADRLAIGGASPRTSMAVASDEADHRRRGGVHARGRPRRATPLQPPGEQRALPGGDWRVWAVRDHRSVALRLVPRRQAAARRRDH